MIDFQNVIGNFLDKQIAKQRVRSNINFHSPLSDELVEQLKEQLTPTVIQVLSSEYGGYKEYFQMEYEQALEKFSDQVQKEEYIRELHKEFPLMEKIIKKNIQNFVQYANEIFKNLKIHQQNKGFKQIEQIELSLGDTHNNGRTVCKLTLDGDSYFYKPRNAALDQRFLHLLSDYLKDYTYEIYSYKDFSIHQEIKSHQYHKEEATISNYFYNMGFISSIFYFMASTDMHFENVIVDGQKPFFIDLETISDLTDFETSTQRNDLFLALSNSVFQSMIYPFEMTDNYLNISALTGEQGEVPKFHYKNTVPTINSNGELDFSEVNPTLERQKNEIFLDNQKQLPSMYSEDITRGFADFCERVLKKPEEIYERLIYVMQDFPIRQIIRPTHVYAKYLNIGTEPYYLRNEENFSELFQHLGNSTPEIIYEEETRHLKNGDIPLFYTYTYSRDIYSGGKILAAGYFSRTIEDNIKERIFSFTKEKLDQEISHISSSLFIHHYNYVKDHKESERTKPVKHENPIHYVEEFIRKFKQVNDSYSALLPSFSGEKMIISPITPSIFDYGGNILLAIYFHEEVGLEMDNLKRMFSTMKKWKTFAYEELSGFNGVSGYLYLLYTTYKITGEAYFYHLLLDEIDQVLLKDPKETKNLDYFTGISGSISILSEIYADMEESLLKERLLDFLTFYTRYLKKNLKHMHDSDSRIGLSHGYSGVIIALSRFARSTGSNENQSLIQELIVIEESYYLVEQNNYLDVRDQTAGKYYVCYGLVGVLFSRLELYENGYTDLKEDIQTRALRLLDDLRNETINLVEYSYCLCHGIGGFIELFQEIERLELLETEKLDPVYDLLFKQLKQNQKNGIDNTFDYDNFMLGAGGAAYNQLRRMYDIPSFIRLKTTSGYRALNLS